ncbi:MAG TPA: hypothetical protein VNT81_23120, partial [Vicinamibacterales bacterium]|nr:hypothetical protein [Vicinamibacterales bacterium]
LGLLLLPAVAVAQEGPGLRRGHFTIGAAVVRSGGYDVGDATAQLRGNGPGASATPFTLFTAKSRVTPATAPLLRIGFALSRSLALEGSATFANPRVAVEISGDAEAPSQELPGEKLQQYQFEAGLTWQLPVLAGRRVATFVGAGGGYLRQLHEDRTLAETGQIYHAGVGARYWLRGGGASSKALGLRGDVRLNLRRKGIDFEDKMRAYPSLSLSAFIGL